MELATAVIFAFLYWWCVIFSKPELGIVAFGVLALYACLFTIIFVIDLEQGLILNKVVYPGMVAALLLALYPWPWFSESLGMRVANAALGGPLALLFSF